MLAMACATLVYGSISDRLGRLPALLGGLALFVLGAGIAAMATSITILLIGRVLQGAGAACGLVLARAILRDVYGQDQLGKRIAYLTTAYVLGPLMAPPLGGLLTDVFGWQSILVLPAAFGLVSIIAALLFIGETSRPQIDARLSLISGYSGLFRTPLFMLFALNPAFGSAAFFSLATAAAYLTIEVLGRSSSEFGLLFMFGPVGYMMGNFLSGRLSDRLSGQFLIVSGSIVALLGGILLIGLIAGFGLTPLGLFIPFSVLALGQGLSIPQAQASAIALEPALTGTASGIVVFLQLLFAAVFPQLVATLWGGTLWPMAIVVGTMALLSALCGVGAVMLARRSTGGT
jgi:DHA1 family bicyclomycin/chloramphenicol resistance-like MFS transporter